jgi:hypothetical protein
MRGTDEKQRETGAGKKFVLAVNTSFARPSQDF